MDIFAGLHVLLEYGPVYLTEKEFDKLKMETIESYNRFLGRCVLKIKGRELWAFHRSRLKELGYPISWREVIKSTIDEITDEIQEPKVAFRKLLQVLRQKYSDLLSHIKHQIPGC
jgi:hypothetical protein